MIFTVVYGNIMKLIFILLYLFNFSGKHMSKILWNQKEIPIPEGAHINNNDHRVYLLIPHPSGKVRNSKRVVIGRQMSSGDMCPNTNF